MELDEKSVKLEQLYALHKNVMLYTAERILRDYQLAEDAVQKAFMKVLDNLHKIEEPDCNKTRAFLVIITRNVAITMYNRQKKLAVPIEEIEQIDCAGGLTPFDLVAAKESVAGDLPAVSWPWRRRNWPLLISGKWKRHSDQTPAAGCTSVLPARGKFCCSK